MYDEYNSVINYGKIHDSYHNVGLVSHELLMQTEFEWMWKYNNYDVIYTYWVIVIRSHYLRHRGVIISKGKSLVAISCLVTNQIFGRAIYYFWILQLFYLSSYVRRFAICFHHANTVLTKKEAIGPNEFE